uniref:Gastric inhibitory polypeptide n=1 Tax=Melopsittacus undulatus TaxID=13146 RepID=A0A8C6K585_MELUD
MSFKVLSLLLASLGFVLMEEIVSGASAGTPSTRSLQRRYSEATLASDYSRTMDNMLKKNFVEWLLARREKKTTGWLQEDLGFFLLWSAALEQRNQNQALCSLEGSEGLKDALSQEFLTWLMSTELCRAT